MNKLTKNILIATGVILLVAGVCWYVKKKKATATGTDADSEADKAAEADIGELDKDAMVVLDKTKEEKIINIKK